MSDPYSANTVLLLHMEGSNGSATFTDSSGLPKIITRHGDAQISTAQSKWGQGSGYFDGDGDYLQTPSSQDFVFGASDFTIESWVYIISYQNYFSVFGTWKDYYNNDASYNLRTTSTGRLAFELKGSSGQNPYALSSESDIVALNTWTHLAGVRYGNTIYGYINGVLKCSASCTGVTLASFTTPPTIGSILGSYYTKGYLQDLRITKGVARYTENFTPPSARLPDPDPVTGLILPSGDRHDLYDGGAYRITGNVDELGVAGSYRVRLFDRQSGRCIRETWSAADGSYAFNYIDYRNKGYFAIAFDHGDNPLNAAIADLITPEPMP